MSRWTDLAPRQEATPNQGGPMVEHRGLVLHIAQGYYEGTIRYQQRPTAQVSSHFVCGDGAAGQGVDGELCQVVDTDVTAWTQQAGNGHWLSVECAGFIPDPLTAAQVESCAQLLARAHHQYGVPLQVAISPEGYGLGHHSMGTNGHDNPTDTWTGPTWGHTQCPGPAIVDQKQAIVDRARQIVGGTPVSGVDINLAQPTGTELGSTLNMWATATRRLPPDLAARLQRIEDKLDQVLAALRGAGAAPTLDQIRGGVRAELDATVLAPRQ